MNKSILTFCLLSGLLFLSCEEDPAVRQDALVNYKVDLMGDWAIFSVERNGEDISALLDYSTFSLQLGDGTFSLANEQVPFPTLGFNDANFSSGAWEFDDDFSPTQIHFVDGGTRVPVQMSFPAYGLNNTSLGLEFSLGCSNTVYTYQFKKQ